ncbi:hypothetical protein C7M84_004779, partial [Penaeus vannamei]
LSFDSKKLESSSQLWWNPREVLSPSYEDTPQNVTALVGDSAFLPCTVSHLGDRSVTWMRQRDLHILTAGVYTYSADERFRVSPPSPGSIYASIKKLEGQSSTKESYTVTDRMFLEAHVPASASLLTCTSSYPSSGNGYDMLAVGLRGGGWGGLVGTGGDAGLRSPPPSLTPPSRLTPPLFPSSLFPYTSSLTSYLPFTPPLSLPPLLPSPPPPFLFPPKHGTFNPRREAPGLPRRLLEPLHHLISPLSKLQRYTSPS